VTHHEHQNYRTAPKPTQNATEATSDNCPTEQKQDTSEHFPDSTLHQKCAMSVHPCQSDPELAIVMEAWAGLPDAIRSAILTLVRSASGGTRP